MSAPNTAPHKNRTLLHCIQEAALAPFQSPSFSQIWPSYTSTTLASEFQKTHACQHQPSTLQFYSFYILENRIQATSAWEAWVCWLKVNYETDNLLYKPLGFSPLLLTNSGSAQDKFTFEFKHVRQVDTSQTLCLGENVSRERLSSRSALPQNPKRNGTLEMSLWK